MSRDYAFSDWRPVVVMAAAAVVLIALGVALSTTDDPCGDPDCTEDHR